MLLKFVRMSHKYPGKCTIQKHDGHIIITYWGGCIKTSKGRINWKKSVGQNVLVCRDGVSKRFKIIKYIDKPSTTAHDAKIKVKDLKTRRTYTVWTRDFKQGDIGQLFA